MQKSVFFLKISVSSFPWDHPFRHHQTLRPTPHCSPRSVPDLLCLLCHLLAPVLEFSPSRFNYECFQQHSAHFWAFWTKGNLFHNISSFSVCVWQSSSRDFLIIQLRRYGQRGCPLWMVDTDNPGNIRQPDRPLCSHSAILMLLVEKLPQKRTSPPSFVSFLQIISGTCAGFPSSWPGCFLRTGAIIIFCIFGEYLSQDDYR